MSLEWLIHAEVTSSLSFSGVELEDFEKALITTDGDITLLLIPSDSIHWRIDADLMKFKYKVIRVAKFMNLPFY
jgi:hypothetical protein